MVMVMVPMWEKEPPTRLYILQDTLYDLTKDDSINSGITGEYRKDIFQGHCKDDGSSHNVNIAGSAETKRRIQELYHTSNTRTCYNLYFVSIPQGSPTVRKIIHTETKMPRPRPSRKRTVISRWQRFPRCWHYQ